MLRKARLSKIDFSQKSFQGLLTMRDEAVAVLLFKANQAATVVSLSTVMVWEFDVMRASIKKKKSEIERKSPTGSNSLVSVAIAEVTLVDSLTSALEKSISLLENALENSNNLLDLESGDSKDCPSNAGVARTSTV